MYMQVHRGRCKDAGGNQLLKDTYNNFNFSKFSLWAAGRRGLIVSTKGNSHEMSIVKN